MPRVDLGPLGDAASRTAADAVVVPGQVRLALGQLALLADRCGGLDLPLRLPPADRFADDGQSLLDQRLSATPPSARRRAQAVLAAQASVAAGDGAGARAAREDLRDRGLLDGDGTPLPEVRGVLALLAAPEALLTLDVVVRRTRLRSWLAVTGRRVAQLSTAGGDQVDLAWGDVSDLPALLARAVAGGDDGEAPSVVPDHFAMPYELYTTGLAAAASRPDLLGAVVARHPDSVRVAGDPVDDGRAAALLAAVAAHGSGRLRVLVTAGATELGVVAWTRVGGGWWALTPSTVDGVAVVTAARVAPHDLGGAVAQVLARVVGGALRRRS